MNTLKLLSSLIPEALDMKNQPNNVVYLFLE